MILDALILQTKLFLSGDMEIDIQDVKINELNPDKLVLKEYTSMIGTGGTLNSMIIISFEKNMLQHLVDIFMDGEEIDEDEIEEINDSVAGETVNTIIGLALPTFPNRGKGVTITPPITVNDASNMKKYKNSVIVTAEISTQYGKLSISAVGSEDSIK